MKSGCHGNMKSLKADAIQCKKYGLIENIKASVQCNLDTTTAASLARVPIHCHITYR